MKRGGSAWPAQPPAWASCSKSRRRKTPTGGVLAPFYGLEICLARTPIAFALLGLLPGGDSTEALEDHGSPCTVTQPAKLPVVEPPWYPNYHFDVIRPAWYPTYDRDVIPVPQDGLWTGARGQR